MDKPCSGCDGEGRRRGTRKLEIRIPAGIETGSRLRLAGEGDAGGRGGPAGDLYVVLTVAEDEVFEREGDDVVLPLDVPFPTLVLGGEFEFRRSRRRRRSRSRAARRPARRSACAAGGSAGSGGAAGETSSCASA